MATKYKEYFDRMVENNKDLFDQFLILHNNYEQDPDKYKKDFDTVGDELLDVAREWENKLCSQTEKGGYGIFSTKLAEKFQNELRQMFPLIDEVGLEESKPAEKDTFSIKKINL